jgi:glycogen debranching enzyme
VYTLIKGGSRRQKLFISSSRKIKVAGILIWLALCAALSPLQAQQSDTISQSFSDRLSLSTNSVGPSRFVAVHSRRSAIMGYPEHGLEIWGYPFQILSNYQIGFKSDGATTESDGQAFLRRIDYRPDSITRIYIGPDYIVREKLFVPLDRAAAVLSYEVESPSPLNIDIHFLPVLNLMWPAAIGGQNTHWDANIPGYVISEPAHGITAVISSQEIVAHDETANSTLRNDGTLSFSLKPRTTSGMSARATVYVALNSPNTKDSVITVQQLSEHLREIEAEVSAHYAQLENQSLKIRTPDEDVNRALAWAEAALDQAWVCNPQLGCGMVAGYGPSRDARRPQYDWFFAGDGLIATNALIATGEYSRARDELAFIIKYQDPKTGMIWHELSQSAGYIDWSKYPYMYVHVDISFDYLNTFARYVTASGDTGFAAANWSSLLAAYRYCKALIQRADHLPHIPPDKEGGDEQHRPGDDLSLSASWVAATAGFSELAKLTGHQQWANEALEENKLTRQSIAIHYWDSRSNFWINSHTLSGASIMSRRRGPMELITQDIFSPPQNDALLNQLASSDFQADWGMRGVAASSDDFHPYSYATGSISALGSTEAAKAFWQAHRPAIAFSLWSSILPWNTLDSLGHIHEVLAGTYYHEQSESVPEQTWSSAGLLDAVSNGLLGLDIQGVTNSIHFVPHLPSEWSHVSVENIRLPHSVLALTVAHDMSAVDLDIRNDGDATRMVFEPQIPIGAHLLSAEFRGSMVSATPELFSEDEHVRMILDIPPGESHCHLRFDGGISIIPNRQILHVGNPSSNMKLTNIHLHDHTLSIEADIHPSGNTTFTISTQWKIVSQEGAIVHVLPGDQYKITLTAESGAISNSLGYIHTHAVLTLAPRV